MHVGVGLGVGLGVELGVVGPGVGLGVGLGVGIGVGLGVGLGVVFSFPSLLGEIKRTRRIRYIYSPHAAKDHFPKLLSFRSEQEEGSFT